MVSNHGELEDALPQIQEIADRIASRHDHPCVEVISVANLGPPILANWFKSWKDSKT